LSSAHELPHETVVPGYSHDEVVELLHLPAHAVPSPAHLDREPWGGPPTGVHVPSWPLTSHAWHWPSQIVLQQKPSTQLWLVHSSPVAHDSPRLFFGTHVPVAPHRLEGVQSAFDVHLVRHPSPAALQR